MNGKYRLDARLGGGGMAEVFVGAAVGAEGFARRVAIKRVLPGFSDNPQFAQMFIDEARISSGLVHPNIVSVLDFDRDPESRLFLVMELVEGRDLDGLNSTGILPIPVVIYVIAETLRGLGYAHDLPVSADMRGIVHRDVSPHNVLLSWEGAVKVSDFGIAKARAASEATASVFIKGKPAYMSPEQANGQPLDGRSDLFAVGVMLWEMLAGRRLFVGEDTRATLAAVLFGQIPRPRTIRPDVPKDLEKVVMKMLERDLPARYPTAEDAVEALLACTDAPRDGRAALIGVLAQRFPHDMPVRQSALRSRSAIPTPPPGAMASTGGRPIAYGATVASSPGVPAVDAMNAPTRQLQPPRAGKRIALLLALTIAVAGGTFGVIVAVTHKSGGGAQGTATPIVDARALDSPAKMSTPDAPPPPADAALDAPPDAPRDAPPPDAAVASKHADAGVDTHHHTQPPPPPADAAVAEASGFGFLSVKQDPPVVVYLDGSSLGETPITHFKLSAGKHRVRRVNIDNHYDKTDTIDVAANATIDLDYVNKLKP